MSAALPLIHAECPECWETLDLCECLPEELEHCDECSEYLSECICELMDEWDADLDDAQTQRADSRGYAEVSR